MIPARQTAGRPAGLNDIIPIADGFGMSAAGSAPAPPPGLIGPRRSEAGPGPHHRLIAP
jgi:hypothetical protein